MNGINLYTYNFETQKITTERTGLDLASSYTMLPIWENVYTVFAREENEKCSIFVHNIQTEEEIILNTPAEVCAPVSNRGYCVWKKGYDYEESKDIFTYDFKNHKAEQINLTEAYSFSHALLDHFVFVNQRGKSAYGSEGLYCFDMINKVYQKLDIGEGEKDTILFIWQGMDENIYFQVGDETTDVRIFNIKVAQQCR